MKLIIAGSRTLHPSLNFIDSIINQNEIMVTELVCGGAKGVDQCGAKWAYFYPEQGVRYHNPVLEIKITNFPADWDKHGKAAGHIRNKQMADYADALLLIWDGESRGSANMKDNMIKLNKPVYEVILRTHNV